MAISLLFTILTQKGWFVCTVLVGVCRLSVSRSAVGINDRKIRTGSLLCHPQPIKQQQ